MKSSLSRFKVGEGGDWEVHEEGTSNGDVIQKICIEYSETMTKPNQEEKIDEKINK